MVSVFNSRDCGISPHQPTLIPQDSEVHNRVWFIDLDLAVLPAGSALKSSPRDAERSPCVVPQRHRSDGASANPAVFRTPLLDIGSVKVKVSTWAAAAVEVSRRCNPLPPTSEAVHAVPQAESEGAWTWVSNGLKQKICAAVRANASDAEPSPARRWGAGAGAVGLLNKLKQDRRREIEEIVEERFAERESKKKKKPRTNPADAVGCKEPRPRTPKKASKELASRLQKKLEKELVDEVKAAGKDVSDEEVKRELHDKMFSRKRGEVTLMLHERYGYPLTGERTLARTPEFISRASHRKRGNARRLDPDSPAASNTASGGRSSRSGRSRDKQYADANELRVVRPTKLPGFDKEARREIAADPEAQKWLQEKGSAIEEPLVG